MSEIQDLPAICKIAIDALEDMKAQDIKILDVRGKTSVTDFMVLATGTSTRHVKSIAGRVVEKANKADHKPLGVEGEGDAEWVLVDLADVIVHVMVAQMRDFYQLEKLWGVAEASREAAETSRK